MNNEFLYKYFLSIFLILENSFHWLRQLKIQIVQYQQRTAHTTVCNSLCFFPIKINYKVLAKAVNQNQMSFI